MKEDSYAISSTQENFNQILNPDFKSKILENHGNMFSNKNADFNNDPKRLIVFRVLTDAPSFGLGFGISPDALAKGIFRVIYYNHEMVDEKLYKECLELISEASEFMKKFFKNLLGPAKIDFVFLPNSFSIKKGVIVLPSKLLKIVNKTELNYEIVRGVAKQWILGINQWFYFSFFFEGLPTFLSWLFFETEKNYKSQEISTLLSARKQQSLILNKVRKLNHDI